MTAYVEDEMTEPGDTPSEDYAYGHVRFTEDTEMKIGYIGGYGDPDHEDDHPAIRMAPFLAWSPDREPTAKQMITAWDLLVEQHVPGFPSADSDCVRVVIEGTLHELQRGILMVLGDMHLKTIGG